jgi:hypothetical protein
MHFQIMLLLVHIYIYIYKIFKNSSLALKCDTRCSKNLIFLNYLLPMDHNNGFKCPMHIQRFRFNGTLRWKKNYKIILIIITQVLGLLENLLMKFENKYP